MSYNNGSLVVEVMSPGDLSNCLFELYLFDFQNGEYRKQPNIQQVISSAFVSQDSGIYRFKHEIPGKCRVKCAISDGTRVLASKERFVGDRYKITVSSENSELGRLYMMKSEISVSRKLIFYKSPVSSIKIQLPGDLIMGETLIFTIKERDFRPKFECPPEFVECFNIEG